MTTDKRWGARSIASLIVFVLAAILTIPALVGHWGHRTVIDSTRYIETVGPLASSPEVQEAVATAVKDAVLAKVDTEKQVDDLLSGLFPDSPIVQNLSAPIAAGINSAIGALVDRFVASDAFQKLWLQLNTSLQRGLVAVLSGETNGTVRLEGDKLVLDISSLLTEVQTYLVNEGITAAGSITIPENDRSIVLAETPLLAQIRFVYSLTSPLLQWAPVIVAAMFALSIWLARRRARTVVATGIVLLASGVVAYQGLTIGEDIFVDQLAGTVFEPASTVFWSTMFQYLVAGTKAVGLLGIAVIVAGWLGGRTRSAQNLRGHLMRGLGEISGRMPEGLQGLLTDSIATVRWIIYALGVVIVMLTDVLAPESVLWTVALVAGLITVAELLAVRPRPEEVEVLEITEVTIES
ncbi:MAG TPA: hypothetical protein DCQ36_09600 [Actinobacteria bacterium]|jgi:hypothetical protein|nr:hypothetical protein [Actinomycetota bacterium]